jgi:hypothetical protein
MTDSKQIAVQDDKTSILSVIERAASDPNVDVAKMKALLDMQIVVMDKQAEIEFNQAMAQLRKELTPIIKNKKNDQTNSRYADLDAIKAVADPLLVKYGFYDRYEEDYPSEGIIGTTCEIVHEKGHSKKNRVQFTLDNMGIKGTVNKTNVHAAASSMTYGQRLSLCRALGIRISEDDDGNLAGAQTITEDQINVLKERLVKSGMDQGKFFVYMRVGGWGEIKVRDLKKAENVIETKIKEDGAKSA